MTGVKQSFQILPTMPLKLLMAPWMHKWLFDHVRRYRPRRRLAHGHENDCDT
jgi:hypothetical protein